MSFLPYLRLVHIEDQDEGLVPGRWKEKRNICRGDPAVSRPQRESVSTQMCSRGSCWTSWSLCVEASQMCHLSFVNAYSTENIKVYKLLHYCVILKVEHGLQLLKGL